jgi:RimJ/RimL family protein N-acetyltransferase
LGKLMLVHLAELACERGYGRFDWTVLDWNEDAIRFYQKLGATVLPEWRICRLSGEALARYGEDHAPPSIWSPSSWLPI